MNDHAAVDNSRRKKITLLSASTIDKYEFTLKSIKEADEFLILCAFGSAEVVRRLLIDDKTHISSLNKMRMNAAHFACYGNNIEVAKLLYAFHSELFDAKTTQGLSCKEVAAKSLSRTDEFTSWLDSLMESKEKEVENPNTKKIRIKESKSVDKNQVTLELSKASFYIDCFSDVENLNFLTAAFQKRKEVESLTSFNVAAQNPNAEGVQNTNGLGMNIFHFACYGGNPFAVEHILKRNPHLLKSLTAEGLSGLDIFDMSFNDNPEFRKWLIDKDPEFFSKNEEIVFAAANHTAPAEQQNDYNTLIQQMITNAPRWNLGKQNKCYVDLCTALQSTDMTDKYSAVQGLLSTVCEIHEIEDIVVNTTLLGFQKALVQLQGRLDAAEKQTISI